jgi:quercetin dioxygenase-like cupin family protein
MTATRIAGGILAVAAVAAATACTSADQPTPTPVATTSPMTATASSQPPTDSLTPLIAQALPNVPGKTFTSAIVDFPPGARAMPHRHGDAFAYAYVLEGTVRSQLDDMPAQTYREGENWVEQPGTHHALAENTSQTDPAKLLVVFIADPGAQLKIDDPHS